MSLDAKAVPRVLVVDDEADILELLELALVRMGLEVVRASGVHQAKQRLDTQSIRSVSDRHAHAGWRRS